MYYDLDTCLKCLNTTTTPHSDGRHSDRPTDQLHTSSAVTARLTYRSTLEGYHDNVPFLIDKGHCDVNSFSGRQGTFLFLTTAASNTPRLPTPVQVEAWVCSRSTAESVGSNPAGDMNVCREYCVLSGRGLCDELITRPEESTECGASLRVI